MMSGNQSTEPLHASPGRPVDEVFFYLQQSVQRELQHLEENTNLFIDVSCVLESHLL